MTAARDSASLLDIARAAGLISQFIADKDEEEFVQDVLVQSAVLHQLLVIGEATKRLSSPFRERSADIPWKLMARMRDRVIHGYDSVNMAQVWHTVSQDIPELLRRIEPLLPPEAP